VENSSLGWVSPCLLSDLLPDGVYGVSAPGLRGYESRVQHDAWADADRLTGVPSTQRLTAARTFAAAEAGHV